MKVVLQVDIKGTGKKGDLINVSDGYARNFLFPKGFAIEANSQALNEIKNREEAKKHHEKIEYDAAVATKEKLDNRKLHFLAKAGQNGRLFGSITTKEISAKIKEEFGIDIDKKKINIKTEIKSFGSFDISIKLNMNVTADMTVVVSEE